MWGVGGGGGRKKNTKLKKEKVIEMIINKSVFRPRHWSRLVNDFSPNTGHTRNVRGFVVVVVDVVHP